MITWMLEDTAHRQCLKATCEAINRGRKFSLLPVYRRNP